MSSLFSFLRPEAETPGEEPPAEPITSEQPTVEPALGDEPIPAAPEVAAALAAAANSPPLPSEILEGMLADLKKYLPEHDESDPLPAPSVSVVKMTERAVGLGNRRGNESRGHFAVVTLKGGRLEAVVRFQLWADNAADVDAAIEALHGRLRQAHDELWVPHHPRDDLPWTARVLQLAAEGTSLAEQVSDLSAWRKTADYWVLYEFHYEDSEGAESLIARIPIHSDPEERDSTQRETTVVTDEMVRWDNESAPPLVVRGPFSLGRLAVLDYLPDPPPSRGVTITRTFDDATGPPTVYLTLDDFLSAVSDRAGPDRHARLTCATLSDFLAAFTDTGETISLGDWDEDEAADQYQPRVLAKRFTDLTIDAVDRTKISSVAKPFDSNDIGKIINITEGEGFMTGRYKITAVDASRVAALDRSCGTTGSTGGTGKIERIRILELPTGADRLEIAFHGDAFDQIGVLYLRAVRT